MFTVVVINVLVDGYQNDFQLLLQDNGPVTTGATVILNATIVDNKGVCVKGSLTFYYEDDAFPRHVLQVSFII